MRLDEYARYDGIGLAELVRRGEVAARELGELALAGVAKVNPRLNAVIETFPERLDRLPAPAGHSAVCRCWSRTSPSRRGCGARWAVSSQPDSHPTMTAH